MIPEINLEDEFPTDGPVGGHKSAETPVTEKVIVSNIYPSQIARVVRQNDFTDGTVGVTFAALVQEILASRSGKRLHGLSATQIGVNLQMTVVDVEESDSDDFKLVTFVNPAITNYSRQGVEWAVNCLTPDCGNTEPGPLWLSAIALDVEARVMRFVKKTQSHTDGPLTQHLPHSYSGVSAQRFYHQWRHLGHPALEMSVVSKEQATSELLRLTRRDNFKE